MSSFKRLTFKEIRKQAEETRIKYSKSDSIPVDIEFIIEHGFDIEIIPITNLKSDLDIEAFVSQDLNSISIDAQSYEQERFQGRSRFSLAHELGHRVLHKDFYNRFNYSTEQEWLDKVHNLGLDELAWYESHANEFAGTILVPTKYLHEEISKLDEDIRDKFDQATGAGLDEYDVIERTKGYIADKICKKFNVSYTTILRRIDREAIDVREI